MSIRQEKVSKLIQKDLGEIFQQVGSDMLPGKMVSVTVVRAAPDLRAAGAYVSVFPTDSSKEDLKVIKSHASELRFQLGKRIKNQLRNVPELFFYLDDSLDYAERIDELLD